MGLGTLQGNAIFGSPVGKQREFNRGAGGHYGRATRDPLDPPPFIQMQRNKPSSATAPTEKQGANRRVEAQPLPCPADVFLIHSIKNPLD